MSEVLKKLSQFELGRRHDVLQPPVRHHVVADELDFLDARLLVLLDREDDVDLAVRQIDHAHRDVGMATSLLAVEVLDALQVGVDHGLAERPARFRQDGQFERIGLELVVALEHHARDLALGIDGDDEIAPLASDRRSWKETGLVELGLGGRRIEQIAVAGHIGLDLLGVDIGIAAHDHLLRQGGQGRTEQDRRHRGRPKRRKPKGSPIKHRPPPL